MATIQPFKQLTVWQEAMTLVVQKQLDTVGRLLIAIRKALR